METVKFSLNESLLEKRADKGGGKRTYRCPACAANGEDKTGYHLVIFASGRWGCVVHQGDKEHNREIFRLVGVKTDGGEREGLTPLQKRKRAEALRWEEIRRREKERFSQTIQENRAALLERFAWPLCDVRKESPLRLDGSHVDDPRLFLRCLFRPSDLVWTGETKWSGSERWARRWRTVEEWQQADPADLGPMTCPATWPAGTLSRSAANVATWPYVVLDFDGPKGWSPKNEEELNEHLTFSLAVVNLLRRDFEWTLSAMVHTGRRSIHAWFAHPGTASLKSLVNICEPLGIDPGVASQPEHPARLPNQRHEKPLPWNPEGPHPVSTVLWLDWNNNPPIK